MDEIFCIISAAGVNYGVFSYDQRIEQLKQTINSIKKYKPNAFICLMEVSDTPINEVDYNELKLSVNKMELLHEHFFIKELLVKLDNQDTNLAARKTVGELIGMLEFLGWLKQQPTKFDRIYKISGRLELNDEFVKTDYSLFKDKVVAIKSWWYDRYAYLIQLWSFDYSLLDTIFEIFVQVWDYEMQILRDEGHLDLVETTLYRYLQKANVPVEELTGYVGVEGFHGQDGAKVYV